MVSYLEVLCLDLSRSKSRSPRTPPINSPIPLGFVPLRRINILRSGADTFEKRQLRALFCDGKSSGDRRIPLISASDMSLGVRARGNQQKIEVSAMAEVHEYTA